MLWPGRPPSVEILHGSPHAWVRLSREDAVCFCRILPVVVVYENLGQWVSGWLSPESPFYLASGPYDYANLRYFLYASNRGSGTGRGGTAPRKASKAKAAKEEAVPAEAIELLEEPSEPTPKPSPLPKQPTFPGRPGLPKETAVPEVAAPDVAVPDVAVPEVAVPEVAAPDVAVPEAAAPGFAVPEVAVPEVAVPEVAVPEVAAPDVAGLDVTVPEADLAEAGLPEGTLPEAVLPAQPVERKPSPVEIRLLSPKGLPLAETDYTMVFPDGSQREGKSDAQGFIKALDNDQPGQVKLTLAGFAG